MIQTQQRTVKVPEALLERIVGILSANPSPTVPVGQIIEVITLLQKCETVIEVGSEDPLQQRDERD